MRSIPSIARLIAVAALVVCAALAGVDARQTSSMRPPSASTTTYGSGPIALSVRGGSEALVLQADGKALSLNTSTGAIGSLIYRVPSGFQAADAAAGQVRGGLVTCFSLNSRSSKESRSYVLQIMPDKREVWTWLRVPGVYVGLAMEPARGLVYVSNSSTNEVFAVTIGEQNARPVRIAAIPDAARLGALAIAPSTRRLYVADISAPRVYTIELSTREVRTVNVGVEEARALAWDGSTKRLFIADSGHETVWVVDPNARSPKVERVVNDKRLRDPAGLTIASDGTLWVADEATRAVFQISPATKSIARTVKWTLPKSAM
jgi:DNA-binding beta-propeller fold protein YncE